jgi:hypothetical protein
VDELERGDLRELAIRQMKVARRLYLVYRKDRPLTAAAQALTNVILAQKKVHGPAKRVS